MNNDRDPQLEALIATNAGETPNGEFANRVMSSVDSRQRNVLFGRISIVILIVALDLILSAPLSGTIGAIADGLSTPLIDIQNEWAALMLGPLNSVAGVIGMLLLVLHFLYRRVIR